ncbi:MAG: polysaccharide deacetylase [Gemmatimonadetes bacterium]|nr:polysaccharide deacetylase [Gemmatimonadota bacterium]
MLRVLPVRLYARLIARDVVGFCYHTVSDEPLAHLKHLYPAKTPAQLTCDLEFIRREFNVVGYDDLRAGRVSARDKRPKALVTFDDGLAECHTIIRPLLLKHGTPAVFFVTTGFLDNRQLFYRHKASLCIEAYRHLPPVAAAAIGSDLAAILDVNGGANGNLPSRLRQTTSQDEPAIDEVCRRLGVDVAGYLQKTAPYLTTAQVQSMASEGFAIGAHGVTHVRLDSLSAADAKAEIVASCSTVATLVDRTEVPFAFPFNGNGVDRGMLRALRASHPQVGLFFDTRMLARDQDFIVNRIVVDEPPRGRRRTTNLSLHMRYAYAAAFGRALADVGTPHPQAASR